ncbi:MAG TPA: AmmeMemoRadiSam system protein B, partial [Rhodocyclaceae bacterium]|nr:AmmeMemoRadiSam system protein B [Rhodocyclaceae bacterium]
MKTRPPAVAGSFYPADPFTLGQQIDDFLAVDGGDKTAAAVAPKVLLCPHAGIIYSGKTAGIGYAQLLAHRARIRRVVLLGPTHRVGIRGLAVPSVDAFATPLGEIPIDRAGRAAALRLPQVAMSDAPHLAEHSLEVQLPFLQRALDRFSVLPLAVGEASAAEVAEVIDAVWGGAETLIVISSDLSHFHAYDEAQVIDRDSIDTVLALAGPLDHEQACGATPLNGLLRVAQRRGLKPLLLDLRNSGDTAGDRRRVVGYAALRFDEAPTAAPRPDEIAALAASPALGVALLGIARQAIQARLSGVAPEILQEPGLTMLDQPAATFVTLTKNGE